MGKVYGIMRYQDYVQVEEITQCLKLNWDYTCKVSDDIPDGRGNGRFNLEFDNNQLGCFKFEAYIRYDWNCCDAMLKINGGEWIHDFEKRPRVDKSDHKSFIKAIMEKAISLCGYLPYVKAINNEEGLNYPSLVIKRILYDANLLRTEGKTFLGASFVKFPIAGAGNCLISTSSDILNDAPNGGAICFHYKQPYTTEEGRTVDNFHAKYYLIGTDKTITDYFRFKHFKWTICIKERYDEWHRHSPYILVGSNEERNDNIVYFATSRLFKSDERLFYFFIQLVNLIDEDSTNDEIKQYVDNYNPETGYTDFIKMLVRNNVTN